MLMTSVLATVASVAPSTQRVPFTSMKSPLRSTVADPPATISTVTSPTASL